MSQITERKKKKREKEHMAFSLVSVLGLSKKLEKRGKRKKG